jgi:hypothetical protein
MTDFLLLLLRDFLDRLIILGIVVILMLLGVFLAA